MQAVILCGGLGTRLKELTKETPKPMLPVAGKPLLQHTIEHLKRHGITKVTLCAGYKAEVVKEFFSGDFGIPVEVIAEDTPLGTAGALKNVQNLDDTFLLLYGDVFIDVNITALVENHEKHSPLATILTGPSTHPWDSDLIEAKENIITKFVHGLDVPRENIGNKSVYVLNKNILTYTPEGKADLITDVFPKAVEKETLRIYHTDEFVRDMGTPERFAIVEQYLKNKAEDKAPGPITCVFLDRDGVLNKHVGYVDKLEQLEILSGVPEAIQLFHEHNIQTIVITNQPVLARGMCTEQTLQKIHEKLKKETGVETIHYCPHHPETQWGEGVKELRRGCDCRKPRPGLIYRAKEKHNLQLKNCVMIGDTERDVQAGKNAGIRTIAIGTDKNGADALYPNLLEAAKSITQ
ncbi:MAG: HAD-IIIA family hydrolase [Candidatus Woesearchaeota archaeon]|nr:HAD-IIIA family hydrolase [Candidatus Woesearchaeota archaeon]